MKITKLKQILYLLKEYERMLEVNRYTPFPYYDTGDLESYYNKLKSMVEEEDETVECCGNCKSLFLFEDDLNNVWCGKCNTPNNTEKCKDINQYIDKYGNIWT